MTIMKNINYDTQAWLEFAARMCDKCAWLACVSLVSMCGYDKNMQLWLGKQLQLGTVGMTIMKNINYDTQAWLEFEVMARISAHG